MSSRQIERCCRENVILMALSADSQSHFSTIADFISSSSEQIIELFRDILLLCNEMGLIGTEMFASVFLWRPIRASPGNLHGQDEAKIKVLPVGNFFKTYFFYSLVRRLAAGKTDYRFLPF
jgi:hypothetical protein